MLPTCASPFDPPPAPQFQLPEVQPKASSGGVIKEQSEWLREPDDCFLVLYSYQERTLLVALTQHLTTSSDMFVTI